MKLLKFIIVLSIILIPFIYAANNYNIEYSSGHVIIINESIINGTKLDCSDVTGASYDVCAGDGSGAGSYALAISAGADNDTINSSETLTITGHGIITVGIVNNELTINASSSAGNGLWDGANNNTPAFHVLYLANGWTVSNGTDLFHQLYANNGFRVENDTLIAISEWQVANDTTNWHTLYTLNGWTVTNGTDLFHQLYGANGFGIGNDTSNWLSLYANNGWDLENTSSLLDIILDDYINFTANKMYYNNITACGPTQILFYDSTGEWICTGGAWLDNGTYLVPNGAYASNVVINGDLTVDTQTFYIDAVDNYIGLGTLNPQHALHLTSDNRKGILIASDNDNSGDEPAYIRFETDAGSTVYEFLLNDSLNSLEWKLNGGGSAYLSSFGNLTLPSLISCDVVETDGSGNLVCGVDDLGGGAGGNWDFDNFSAAYSNNGYQFANFSNDYANNGFRNENDTQVSASEWQLSNDTSNWLSQYGLNGWAFLNFSTAYGNNGWQTANDTANWLSLYENNGFRLENVSIVDTTIGNCSGTNSCNSIIYTNNASSYLRNNTQATLDYLFVDQNTDFLGLVIDTEATTLGNFGLNVIADQGAIGARFIYTSSALTDISRPPGDTTGSNYFFRNLASASTGGPLVLIDNTNAGDDQNSLEISNDGTGYAIQTTNGNSRFAQNVTIEKNLEVQENLTVSNTLFYHNGSGLCIGSC